MLRLTLVLALWPHVTAKPALRPSGAKSSGSGLRLQTQAGETKTQEAGSAAVAPLEAGACGRADVTVQFDMVADADTTWLSDDDDSPPSVALASAADVRGAGGVMATHGHIHLSPHDDANLMNEELTTHAMTTAAASQRLAGLLVQVARSPRSHPKLASVLSLCLMLMLCRGLLLPLRLGGAAAAASTAAAAEPSGLVESLAASLARLAHSGSYATFTELA